MRIGDRVRIRGSLSDSIWGFIEEDMTVTKSDGYERMISWDKFGVRWISHEGRPSDDLVWLYPFQLELVP